MAINIFSGSTGRNGKTDKPRSQKPAAQTVDTTVPVTSGKSTLSKVTGIIGKVGSIAEKYGNLIPGIGGTVSTIGKILSKNDPEWWMHVPGTGVSTNIPLASRNVQASLESVQDSAGTPQTATVNQLRPGILEILSGYRYQRREEEIDLSWPDYKRTALYPTESMVSTYLMQNVRKVVNAIPLQNVSAYRDVLALQASVYALKHNLDKYIVLASQSKPFLPALTDGSYPILAPENYALLVGFRDRLAEYCKASVRLPHTLCQYLAWRYGRVYRTSTSDKAALVMYDLLPMSAPIDMYRDAVNYYLGFVASDESFFGYEYVSNEKMAAQADLYNAYLHHIHDVEVRSETQFTYDPKEFVLRTNLDVVSGNGTTYGLVETDNVYMDSALDNKTTFMASTVSTHARTPSSLESFVMPLFPVVGIYAHFVPPVNYVDNVMIMSGSDGDAVNFYGEYFRYVEDGSTYQWESPYRHLGTWSTFALHPFMGIAYKGDYSEDGSAPSFNNWYPSNLLRAIMIAVTFAKGLDLYNAEIYLPVFCSSSEYSPYGSIQIDYHPALDLTALSQDMASVSGDIIQNTQVYAFANLVTLDVVSYAAKETPAAIKDSNTAIKEIVDSVTPASVHPI